MSSPWQSGVRAQALEVLPEIDSLAKELLTPEKYGETNKVASIPSQAMGKKKMGTRKINHGGRLQANPTAVLPLASDSRLA
jgi:hypothetical protein